MIISQNMIIKAKISETLHRDDIKLSEKKFSRYRNIFNSKICEYDITSKSTLGSITIEQKFTRNDLLTISAYCLFTS